MNQGQGHVYCAMSLSLMVDGRVTLKAYAGAIIIE